MTFEEYHQHVMRTAKDTSDITKQWMNAALGLGEAGEIQNLIKKCIFHGHELDAEELISELGDLLFYVDWLASSIGSDLHAVALYNVDKLRKRYPNGFTTFDSINRKE